MNQKQTENIQNWEKDAPPLVSICCITYNHKPYISETIDSLLMQETDFPFEIIIHDDASDDGTTDIVMDYAKKYPDIIKTIIQTKNQFSQGLRCGVIAINEARGEFVCFCEGDDYWSSNEKLQLQVNLMRLEPKVNLCFHSASIVHMDTEDKTIRDFKYGYCGDEIKIIPCREIILKGGGFMALASIMIRRKIISDLKKKDASFLKFNMTHFFYQVFGASGGGALYLPKNMSVYRSMHKGSWSYRVENDMAFHITAAVKYIESVLCADKITDFRYKKEFDEIIQTRIFATVQNLSVPISDRKKFYKKYYCYLGVGNRLLWNFVLRWRIFHITVFHLIKWLGLR